MVFQNLLHTLISIDFYSKRSCNKAENLTFFGFKISLEIDINSEFNNLYKQLIYLKFDVNKTSDEVMIYFPIFSHLLKNLSIRQRLSI